MCRRNILFACVLMAAFLAASCSQTRKISSKKIEPIPAKLTKLSYEDLMDSIAIHNILPTNLNCRFDAQIIDKSANKTQNVKGVLSYNDDRMVLQITASGLNVAAAMITSDGAFIINKLQKTYTAEPLTTNDFATLQDMKHLVVGMKADLLAEQLFSYLISSCYSICYENVSELLYTIDYNQNFKAEKMIVGENIRPIIVISYFDFLEVESRILPTKINVEIESIERICNIKLSKINFEKTNVAEIRIPDNYKKVKMF